MYRWFDDKLQLLRVTNSNQRFYAPKYFLEHPDLYRSLLYHPGHERNFNKTWRPPWLSAERVVAVSFYVNFDFVIYKTAVKYQLLCFFVEIIKIDIFHMTVFTDLLSSRFKTETISFFCRFIRNWKIRLTDYVKHWERSMSENGWQRSLNAMCRRYKAVIPSQSSDGHHQRLRTELWNEKVMEIKK